MRDRGAPPRPDRGLLATVRGRRRLFAALYFLEGAPIGFVWWTLPTLLAGAGRGEPEIAALLSLLVLPWALKVLWAPLVDSLRGPRWTERGWIATAQLVMAASLVPLAVAGPTADLDLLRAALVVHAFAAATQDVAIDALAVRTTTAAERGRLNGWMNAGMWGARALFSAGALWAAPRLGERTAVVALLAVLAGGLALSLLYRPAAPQRSAPGPGRPPALSRARHVGRHLTRALRSARTWRMLAFAALGGAGFEAVGAMLGPLLLKAGGSEDTVAGFYALPAWAASIAGGLAAGRLADRRGHRPAVVLSSVVLCAAVTAVAGAAARGAGPEALLALLALVYLGIGAFTASSYALFMDATDPEVGSTQFSAYMGATNLCESWAVRATGAIAATGGLAADGSGGLATAFAALAGVSLLALLLLRRSGPVAGDGPGDPRRPAGSAGPR